MYVEFQLKEVLRFDACRIPAERRCYVLMHVEFQLKEGATF
jgi:hypothetical protein